MTGFENDELSRSRIVSEINKNIFVEAGAGSGKTTMLVNRMVAMVEAGIDISKICAITFTKAAAGEFYDRFQRKLIERSNPAFTGEDVIRPGMLPKPTDETRERCRTALRNIDLCFMGTIDSFCGMVLSEHPSEAGIPSDASIVSDEEAAMLYKQQYVKICEGEYGEELRSLAKSFQMLHRNARDVFVKAISFVMNNRNVRFICNEACEADIDKVFAAERRKLIRAVECLLDHPELKYKEYKKSREAWDKIADIHKNIRGRWSTSFTNVMHGIKDLKEIRLIPEAMNHYADSLSPVFVPGGSTGKWFECTVGQEGGLLEKLQKLQYDASMTFLIRSIPVMEQELREKGSLTYFDYLYYLRNMLKRDAEADGKLSRYIYDRHSYFLIDEFQDTNPLQAEVFFYLSSERPVPQWSACVPRQGSLFIVGDPKQSIYRFRSADVTSFLKVKRLFKENGGSVLNLSRNYRSVRTLCEYFNRVFARMLPEETENQSRFDEIPLPLPDEEDFQGVYSYKAYTGQAEVEHPKETDPVQIAKIVENLVGNGKFLIRDEESKELRPIRCSDIMVITYGKKSLGPIKKQLDAKGIPGKVEGSISFEANQALHEISLIYNAVTNAGDPLALYAALTGKLINLTKEDLLYYIACGGTVSMQAAFDHAPYDDEAAWKVAAQIDRLKYLSIAALNHSPAALFSRIMDEYRIYQAVPAKNLEEVYYALELIRNAEKSGLLASPKDGAAYIRELIEGATGEERCLSLTQDKNCVHLANLHKVKGLEAPIVILAAATNKPGSVSYRMIHGDNGSEGYIFSLESKPGENGKTNKWFSTADYSDEKAAETEALKAEDLRLVYVATTRARNALILCNSVQVRYGKESPNSMWSPIMEPNLPDIFGIIGDSTGHTMNVGTKVRAAALYEAAMQEMVLNDRTAETATYKAETPSHLHVPSKLEESPEFEAEGETPEIVPDTEEACKGDRRFSALLGTMMHKLMETLVTTRNTLDVKAVVGEIVREYSDPATDGYESDLTEILLKAANRILDGGFPQTNGLPEDILGTLLSADEVYCEVPFSYLEESRESTVWNGVMDVIYSVNGQWHIIDYKTNADGNDLDTKYRGQLSAYVNAFKATTGLDADAYTYHIHI